MKTKINAHQQINNHFPIGVFDSGVGGLSIATCIKNTLPNESLIYLADSYFAPYGELSNLEIVRRVADIADYFTKQQCKALVVACNTATVNAIENLRQKLTIPVIGVEPAIKPAALASQTKHIAILVTRATAHNENFLRLVELFKGDCHVHIQACPGLVDLIEQGLHNSPKMITLLERYVRPLRVHNVDHIVLGCTHYPFVAAQIQAIAGEQVTLMETAHPVTLQLQRQLNAFQIEAAVDHIPSYQFMSSSPNEQQNQFLSTIWRSELEFTSFN